MKPIRNKIHRQQNNKARFLILALPLFLFFFSAHSSFGVIIENYKAANGFMANRENIKAIYGFYEKLYKEQPTQFYWAGLAKLVGAPVYAGLSDIQQATNIAAQFGMDTTATTVQNRLIQMNIDIFQDLAWQFEAYLKGGMDALNEAAAASGYNTDVIDLVPWQKIDEGIRLNDPGEIRDGNELLAQREQLKILQPDYNILNAISGVASFFSEFAKNPIPNGPDFSTVVPNGNICVFNDRWQWVSETGDGIWPLWAWTSQANQRNWVQIPLATRAAVYAQLPPIIQ